MSNSGDKKIKIDNRIHSWRTVPLGSEVTFLSGGTPSRSKPKYRGGKIPWVSSAEMTQSRIEDTTRRVTEEGADNGTKRVPPKTILVVVRGMSLAKEFRVAITTRDVTFNQDLKAILPSENVHAEFLYYYLLSQNGPIKDSASEAAHGTKKMDMRVLEHWPLPLPPLPLQQKIAAILSAYDDLIENNKRRIVLLEKMAEEIYREWFVRMRFPGHVSFKFAKGTPENWRLLKIEDIGDEIRQGIKKSALGEDKKYIGLEHLPRKAITIADYDTADSVQSNKSLFKKRDILFGKIRPYLHKVAIAHFSGVCSTDIIVIRPKHRKYEGFLLSTVFSETFVELATIASKGTKMPRADWDFLKKLELKIPDDYFLKLFQDRFENFFLQIRNLNESNRNLSKCRDKLLGRLISGKLPVNSLDIQFPPSIQTQQDAAHA